mmetsp:Transcript_90793/g.261619  ORF Transcript_90793/g.261619 Transcript_90793/m.261619 type:complete len:219 (-) Transcript_90793:13-669(-)
MVRGQLPLHRSRGAFELRHHVWRGARYVPFVRHDGRGRLLRDAPFGARIQGLRKFGCRPLHARARVHRFHRNTLDDVLARRRPRNGQGGMSGQQFGYRDQPASGAHTCILAFAERLRLAFPDRLVAVVRCLAHGFDGQYRRDGEQLELVHGHIGRHLGEAEPGASTTTPAPHHAHGARPPRAVGVRIVQGAAAWRPQQNAIGSALGGDIDCVNGLLVR